MLIKGYKIINTPPLPLVADSLYFETVHMISEDWPLGDSEKVFKAGERLVMVCEDVTV